MLRIPSLAAALLALPLSGVAADAAIAAQQQERAEPVCPAGAEPLPAALSGWPAKAPLAAAADMAGLPAATVTPGKAVDLTLLPTPQVHYALRPERPGGSVSHGGMVAFAVPSAGTYRVALGSGAWIDMVRDGTAMASTAHGRGPACSGIHKMVDFALEPGSYTLQIVGNGTPGVAVLVTRLP